MNRAEHRTTAQLLLDNYREDAALLVESIDTERDAEVKSTASMRFLIAEAIAANAHATIALAMATEEQGHRITAEINRAARTLRPVPAVRDGGDRNRVILYLLVALFVALAAAVVCWVVIL